MLPVTHITYQVSNIFMSSIANISGVKFETVQQTELHSLVVRALCRNHRVACLPVLEFFVVAAGLV